MSTEHGFVVLPPSDVEFNMLFPISYCKKAEQKSSATRRNKKIRRKKIDSSFPFLGTNVSLCLCVCVCVSDEGFEINSLGMSDDEGGWMDTLLACPRLHFL